MSNSKRQIHKFTLNSIRCIGVFLCTSFMSISAYSAIDQITFDGNSLPVLKVTPEKNTGLDMIYVAYNTNGLNIKFDVDDKSMLKIYRYSNLGGAFAEEINNFTVSGNTVKISNVDGDMGYILEYGDRRYYFWLINYEPYRFSIREIRSSGSGNCDETILDFNGTASPIHYYTINGQQRVLSREISVEYDTEEWSNAEKQFVKVPLKKVYDYLNETLRITPPVLCATYFTISGDRFLREWNWLQIKESEVVSPVAVSVMAEAIQEDNSSENSNQIKSDGSALGGSAPAEIQFISHVTEGVIHYEWQMSRDADFANVEYRFSEKDLDYTFNQEGDYFIRFIGSNNDGSCESVSDSFTVNIGSSELKCPNAFSPDNDGVNDEWKVSYRSIVEFKCWIFDRNGREMAYFDSPDKGWDGKYRGKSVAPGVYYYVIQAKGADGKKYKNTGDINIIRHNYTKTGTTVEE